MLTHTKFQHVKAVFHHYVHDYILYWSHVSVATLTDGKHAKNVRQSIKKTCREKEKVENKNIGYCKGFCVTRKHKIIRLRLKQHKRKQKKLLFSFKNFSSQQFISFGNLVFVENMKLACVTLYFMSIMIISLFYNFMKKAPRKTCENTVFADLHFFVFLSLYRKMQFSENSHSLMFYVVLFKAR